MKKLVILTLVSFMVLQACKKNTTTCGVNDPAKDLPWLAEIIALAEKDTTGNYYGTIYLESYKGKNVFWVDMMMGSGGLAGHWFNCYGNRVVMNEAEGDIARPKQNKIIYSNIDF